MDFRDWAARTTCRRRWTSMTELQEQPFCSYFGYSATLYLSWAITFERYGNFDPRICPYREILAVWAITFERYDKFDPGICPYREILAVRNGNAISERCIGQGKFSHTMPSALIRNPNTPSVSEWIRMWGHCIGVAWPRVFVKNHPNCIFIFTPCVSPH